MANWLFHCSLGHDQALEQLSVGLLTDDDVEPFENAAIQPAIHSSFIYMIVMIGHN